MTKASYYVAVHTLDQSEKQYSLIWKKNLYQFKLTKVNGKKIDQKGKKLQNKGLL